jgi:S-adenosylmethionine:tRNA ribosyltransferase-isomerase
VGLGTFAPLRVERVDDVRLHRERYTISAAGGGCQSRRREGRRIVAVGTTWCARWRRPRLSAHGSELQPHSGETEIFISPGFEFRWWARCSPTFICPIEPADAGERLCRPRARAGRLSSRGRAKYRFFSYGDCMFHRVTAFRR